MKYQQCNGGGGHHCYGPIPRGVIGLVGHDTYYKQAHPGDFLLQIARVKSYNLKLVGCSLLQSTDC